MQQLDLEFACETSSKSQSDSHYNAPEFESCTGGTNGKDKFKHQQLLNIREESKHAQSFHSNRMTDIYEYTSSHK